MLLDAAAPTDDGPHRRFTTALAHVRDLFANVSSTLSAVETSADIDEPLSEAAQHAVPEALRELSTGVDALRRVRTQVADSDNSVLPGPVRMQVIWDIDRMVADAERLRSQSLAPLARDALMKALQLRFGVLLTPAFWTTPIRRDLLRSDEGSSRAEASGDATAAGGDADSEQEH